MGSSGGTAGGGGSSITTPATTTNKAVTRFVGTGGQEITDSLLVVSDAGDGTGLTKLDVDNLRLDGNTISSTNTNGDIILTPDGSGRVVVGDGKELRLPQENQIASPSLNFGDGDTGIYELSDDRLIIVTDGGGNFTAVDVTASTGLVDIVRSSGQPLLRVNNSCAMGYLPAATQPSVLPLYSDLGTGIGRAGVNQLSLIAGNVEAARATTAGTVFGGGANFKGFTSSADAPSVTEYPANKDWGFHLNTGSGTVSIAYNLSGVIKTVALS